MRQNPESWMRAGVAPRPTAALTAGHGPVKRLLQDLPEPWVRLAAQTSKRADTRHSGSGWWLSLACVASLPGIPPVREYQRLPQLGTPAVAGTAAGVPGRDGAGRCRHPDPGIPGKRSGPPGRRPARGGGECYSVFQARSGSAEAMATIRLYACAKPAMVSWSNAPELNSTRHFIPPEESGCMVHTAPLAS